MQPPAENHTCKTNPPRMQPTGRRLGVSTEDLGHTAHEGGFAATCSEAGQKEGVGEGCSAIRARPGRYLSIPGRAVVQTRCIPAPLPDSKQGRAESGGWWRAGTDGRVRSLSCAGRSGPYRSQRPGPPRRSSGPQPGRSGSACCAWTARWAGGGCKRTGCVRRERHRKKGENSTRARVRTLATAERGREVCEHEIVNRVLGYGVGVGVACGAPSTQQAHQKPSVATYRLGLHGPAERGAHTWKGNTMSGQWDMGKSHARAAKADEGW